VPAVWVGTVVVAPLLLPAMMKPAVLKVVVQLLPLAQATPSGQHWRALAPGMDSFDSVTLTGAPCVAAPWLSVVLATPVASKLIVVAARLPALAASVAVLPAAPV
jgi:hypothetical protein